MPYKHTMQSASKNKIENKDASDSFSEFEPLLSPREAAAILTVTTGTLAVWRSTNRYRLQYLKVGGRVMYRPHDLRTFLEERLIVPTAPVQGV